MFPQRRGMPGREAIRIDRSGREQLLKMRDQPLVHIRLHRAALILVIPDK